MKKEANRPLISPTTLIKPFTSMLMKDIPTWILESSRQFGSVLMADLEEEYLNLKKPTELTKRIKEEINKIGPIKEVEGFRKNDFYNGTVDIIGDTFFVEIKTRTNNNIRWSDRIQILIYWDLLEKIKTPYILIFNKKTGKITMETIIFDLKDFELKNSFESIYKNLWKEKKLWKDDRYKNV